MGGVDLTNMRRGSDLIKRGFARMQQGGVIMDVVDAEQAAVAEDAGAVAVMALERVPADIRKAGGVARMSHPDMVQGILDCTSIPVMAKARIGHDGEARILEAMGVDMIDESNCGIATPADASLMMQMGVDGIFVGSGIFKSDDPETWLTLSC
jgi:pyridoxal 5'-phosphate synthase pdxS subunit